MNHFSEGWLPSAPDPRLDNYALMSTWYPTAFISLAYAVGVYAWKGRIQEQRNRLKAQSTNGVASKTSPEPPSRLSLIHPLMVLYNVVMVFFSAYLVISCGKAVHQLGYGLGCETIPDPKDPKTNALLFAGYMFFVSKLIELLDTIFFLLRGKIDQVTFLHVFHHATMPPSIWWGLKYAPGGMVYTFLMANSLIHTIMYTYYGMAALGLYKYLWWKNYLTVGQMLQFAFFILHQGQIFVRPTLCNYPKIFPFMIVVYAVIFLFLFGDFYVKAYWRRQRLAKSACEKIVGNGAAANGLKLQSNGHTSREKGE